MAGVTAPGARRFAANAASLVVAQAVGKAASFVFVLIVTRGLGTVEYGYFNFAVSFVPLFLILGTWGLDVAIVRGVAADKDRLSPLVASGIAVRAGSGAIALALAFALGVVLTDNATAYATLLLVGVALLLDEVTTLLGTVFNLFERTAALSMVLLVNRILSTLLALAAIAADADIVVVSATYLAGSTGALLVAVTFLRRWFPPIHLRDASRATATTLMRQGAPLGIAGALNMALFRVDAVLLQAMKGATAVGMYGIAYRFLDSFLFVAYGVGQVLMPRVAKEGARSFSLVLSVVLAFYLPIAVGALFTARWIVTTLFGDEFAAATDAVKWLTGAGVFYAIAYLARVSSVALGRRRQIALIAGGVLVLNVVANLIVIPDHGFNGAAAVTFFSEVVEALALLVVFGPVAKARVVLVPLAATAVMAAALWLADLDGGTAVAAGAIVYAIALPAAARLIAADDTARLVGAIRQRQRA